MDREKQLEACRRIVADIRSRPLTVKHCLAVFITLLHMITIIFCMCVIMLAAADKTIDIRTLVVVIILLLVKIKSGDYIGYSADVAILAARVDRFLLIESALPDPVFNESFDAILDAYQRNTNVADTK